MLATCAVLLTLVVAAAQASNPTLTVLVDESVAPNQRVNITLTLTQSPTTFLKTSVSAVVKFSSEDLFPQTVEIINGVGSLEVSFNLCGQVQIAAGLVATDVSLRGLSGSATVWVSAQTPIVTSVQFEESSFWGDSVKPVVVAGDTPTPASRLELLDACGKLLRFANSSDNVSCSVTSAQQRFISAVPTTTDTNGAIRVTLPSSLLSKIVCAFVLVCSVNSIATSTSFVLTQPVATLDRQPMRFAATGSKDGNINGRLISRDGSVFHLGSQTAVVVARNFRMSAPDAETQVFLNGTFSLRVNVEQFFDGSAGQCRDFANSDVRVRVIVYAGNATLELPWQRIEWLTPRRDGRVTTIRLGSSPLLWSTHVPVYINERGEVGTPKLFVSLNDVCDNAVLSAEGTVTLFASNGTHFRNVSAAHVRGGRVEIPPADLGVSNATFNVSFTSSGYGTFLIMSGGRPTSSHLGLSITGGPNTIGGRSYEMIDPITLSVRSATPTLLYINVFSDFAVLDDTTQTIQVATAPVIEMSSQLHIRNVSFINVTTTFGVGFVPILYAGCAPVGVQRLIFVTEAGETFFTPPLKIRNQASASAASVELLSAPTEAFTSIPFIQRDACGSLTSTSPLVATPELRVVTSVGFEYAIAGHLSHGGEVGYFCDVSVPSSSAVTAALRTVVLAPSAVFEPVLSLVIDSSSLNHSSPTPQSYNYTNETANTTATSAPTTQTNTTVNQTATTSLPQTTPLPPPQTTPAPPSICSNVVCPDGTCVAEPKFCNCSREGLLRDLRLQSADGNPVPSVILFGSTVLLTATVKLRSPTCSSAISLDKYIVYKWVVLFSANNSAVESVSGKLTNASTFACHTSDLPPNALLRITVTASAPELGNITSLSAAVNVTIARSQPTVTITDRGEELTVSSTNIFVPATVADPSLGGAEPLRCTWSCSTSNCPNNLASAVASITSCRGILIRDLIIPAGRYNLTLAYAGVVSTPLILNVQEAAVPVAFIKLTTPPVIDDNVFSANQMIDCSSAVLFDSAVKLWWSVNGNNVSSAHSMSRHASTFFKSTNLSTGAVPNTIALHVVSANDSSVSTSTVITVFVVNQPSMTVGSVTNVDYPNANNATALADEINVGVSLVNVLSGMQTTVTASLLDVVPGVGIYAFRSIASSFDGSLLSFTTPLPMVSQSSTILTMATIRVELRISGRMLASRNLSLAIILPSRNEAVANQLLVLDGSGSTSTRLAAAASVTSLVSQVSNETLRDEVLHTVLVNLKSVDTASLTSTEQSQILQSLIGVVSSGAPTFSSAATSQTVLDLLSRTVASTSFDPNSNGLVALALISTIDSSGNTTAAYSSALSSLAQSVVGAAPVGTTSLLEVNGVAVGGLRQTASALRGASVVTQNATFTAPPDFLNSAFPTAIVALTSTTQSINPFNSTLPIASSVVSFDVSVDDVVTAIQNLATPIQIVFAQAPASGSRRLRCMFHDSDANTWSSEGVSTTSRDNGSVECLTDHLTSFAVFSAASSVAFSATVVMLVVVFSFFMV